MAGPQDEHDAVMPGGRLNEPGLGGVAVPEASPEFRTLTTTEPESESAAE